MLERNDVGAAINALLRRPFKITESIICSADSATGAGGEDVPARDAEMLAFREFRAKGRLDLIATE